jgi:hypothetical protein
VNNKRGGTSEFQFLKNIEIETGSDSIDVKNVARLGQCPNIAKKLKF